MPVRCSGTAGSNPLSLSIGGPTVTPTLGGSSALQQSWQRQRGASVATLWTRTTCQKMPQGITLGRSTHVILTCSGPALSPLLPAPCRSCTPVIAARRRIRRGRRRHWQVRQALPGVPSLRRVSTQVGSAHPPTPHIPVLSSPLSFFERTRVLHRASAGRVIGCISLDSFVPRRSLSSTGHGGLALVRTA